jgi:NAD+ synthase (glutamine-hydrolysing)
MNALRIVLGQINPTVGALGPNAQRMAKVASEAAARGARVVVFPELAVTGYPPEDLVLKPHFVEAARAEVQQLAQALPPGLTAIVGTPWPGHGRAFNAAVVLRDGRIHAVYHKMLLPNYGVFDEKRVFEPGRDPGVIEVDGWRIGLHICEDSWFPEAAPCSALREAGVEAVINLSASPYHRGKLAQREAVLGRAARAVGAPLLYCNLVGGQDELVFDGASLVVDAAGQLVARAQSFAEDQLVLDLPRVGKMRAESSNDWKTAAPAAGRIAPAPEGPSEVYAALQLGLRDYVDKNGFRKVLVAISGGIDSALVAAIAVDALGSDRVVGVTMPSQYSSHETLDDAHVLARNLGITLHELPIRRLHEEYLRDLAGLWPDRAPDATEENLQARIRGNLIMALSNKFGWLVVTTGNKSEIATGYCTLYGDMAGGFALIKDVPKTLVWELARWRNGPGRANPPGEPHAPNAARRDASPYPCGEGPIPVSTIERPPSAELRPDQKDTDSLPPYDVLDPIIERYVERDQGLAELVAAGFDAALVQRVLRLIDLNEYKRRQGAPGVKITPKAFGRDRRLPITNHYREQA